MSNVTKCPASNNQAANYWINQNPVTDIEFIQIVENHLDEVTNSIKDVLNTTILLSYKHKDVWARQDTIGDIGNKYSRRSVNRAMKVLDHLGIVRKINRGAHKTCIYIISPHFRNRKVVRALRDKLPALKLFLCLSLLTSYSSFSENVSQRYIGDKEMRESSLLALPEEAISYATKVFKRNIRDVKNRLHYIMTVGLNYCKRHHLSVDWALSAKLSELGDNSDTQIIKTSFSPKTVEQYESNNPYQTPQIVIGEVEPGTSINGKTGGMWMDTMSIIDGHHIPDSDELRYIYPETIVFTEEELDTVYDEDIVWEEITDEPVRDFYEN